MRIGYSSFSSCGRGLIEGEYTPAPVVRRGREYTGRMKKLPVDRKRLIRERDHFTVPPRLEGKVKNAMMNPVRKKRK